MEVCRSTAWVGAARIKGHGLPKLESPSCMRGLLGRKRVSNAWVALLRAVHGKASSILPFSTSDPSLSYIGI